MPGSIEKKGILTVPTQPLQKNERGAQHVTEKFNKLSELVNRVSPIRSKPSKVKTKPKVISTVTVTSTPSKKSKF